MKAKRVQTRDEIGDEAREWEKWERTTVRGGVPCEWMANLTWFKLEERIVT